MTDDVDEKLARRYPLLYAKPGTCMIGPDGDLYVRLDGDDDPHVSHCAVNVETGRIIHAAKIIREMEPIEEVMAKAARSHIKQALEATNGNKTRAAELLGMKSYQTLTNWMKKYGVEDND